jgi:hypothetical protein
LINKGKFCQPIAGMRNHGCHMRTLTRQKLPEYISHDIKEVVQRNRAGGISLLANDCYRQTT